METDQMAAALPAQGFRLNGWHVLAMTVAFFAVVIAVDMSFLFIAYKTHPGQVSVTPYEDGLAHDADVARLAAQTRLGWKASLGNGPDGRLVFEMLDASGRPLSGLSVVGKLEHPATEEGSISVVFRQIAPGRYEAHPGKLTGAWDVTVDSRDAQGHPFRAERRLMWP
jgi:nitrogen fixation protein FixH